ncbi:MAG: hypothetical protein M0R80_06730 [Proteobacteria bacterium]|jgi:hypothetical protein|nr:hypothetical protein [Pseudomonadota bacterium]
MLRSVLIQWLPAERRWRYLTLAVIVCVFAVLKLNFNPGLGRPCLDGDYYFQIARNVAEGNGLATNLSLYNQGIKNFPHKINHSPVWPLTMGYLGKVFDLERVAVVLPEIIYLLDLVLLYFLVARLMRRAGTDKNRILFVVNGRFVDVGHIIVALFGANCVFFEFTSLPYTEAMAFMFIFAAAIVADEAAARRSLKVAALAGVLAGLGFLTRTQNLGPMLALPLVFAVAGFRQRKFFAMACAAAAASALVLVPWVAWVASWADVAGWQTFAGLGAMREVPELTAFRHTVAAANLEQRVGQIQDGLSIAFSMKDNNSYFYSFGWVIYSVPLGLLAALSDWSEVKRIFRRAFSPEGCLLLFLVLSTIAMLIPLHIEKRQFFKAWLFGWRHGLPFVLFVAIATSYLLVGQQKLGRAVAVLLLVGSFMHNYDTIGRLFDKKYVSGLSGPEVPLVKWLDSQDPKPTVITTHSQILSAFSRSYFHWIDCKVSAAHTIALLEKGNADYVLVYPKLAGCKYFAPVKARMERVKRFTKGWSIDVWKLKDEEAAAAAQP